MYYKTKIKLSCIKSESSFSFRVAIQIYVIYHIVKHYVEKWNDTKFTQNFSVMTFIQLCNIQQALKTDFDLPQVPKNKQS